MHMQDRAVLKSPDVAKEAHMQTQAGAITAMQGGRPSRGLIHSEKRLLKQTRERD